MGAYTCKDLHQVKEQIEALYVLFPRLKERRRQLAGTLSGGEQQMLAIARALVARPGLLLLDEPSMGLAPKMLESIFKSVLDVNQKGTTVLLVEQNTQIALDIASRGYVMQTGEITLAGTTKSLKNNEMVKKTYLGIS
jgi:branched-chain amino acid transport system ATP-binding protein